MQRYVGLIRGINVGGAKKVSMAKLKFVLAGIGLQEPQTLLQSGNVVFLGQDDPNLESKIEREIAQRLSVTAEVYVRTAEAWITLIADNPHFEMAACDPSHLLAIVFRKLPTQTELDAALNGYVGPEEIRLGAEAVYATFPEGIGASKLSAWPAWKKLNAHGTARNWNTVLKLGELAGR